MKNRNNRHITSTINKMKVPWNSPVNVLDLYDAMFDHCKAEGKNPERFTWELVENFLFCDGTLLAVL